MLKPAVHLPLAVQVAQFQGDQRLEQEAARQRVQQAAQVRRIPERLKGAAENQRRRGKFNNRHQRENLVHGRQQRQATERAVGQVQPRAGRQPAIVAITPHGRGKD